METRFAKVIRTPEGWDGIEIDGVVVFLDVAERDNNTRIVDAIVKGLRNQGWGRPSHSPQNSIFYSESPDSTAYYARGVNGIGY